MCLHIDRPAAARHNERVIARVLVAALLWLAAWTAAAHAIDTAAPQLTASVTAPMACGASVPDGGGTDGPAWHALVRGADTIVKSFRQLQPGRVDLAGARFVAAGSRPTALAAPPVPPCGAFAHLHAIPLLI